MALTQCIKLNFSLQTITNFCGKKRFNFQLWAYLLANCSHLPLSGVGRKITIQVVVGSISTFHPKWLNLLDFQKEMHAQSVYGIRMVEFVTNRTLSSHCNVFRQNHMVFNMKSMLVFLHEPLDNSASV